MSTPAANPSSPSSAPDPPSAVARPRHPRRFAAIFGGLAVLLTVGAIALAIAAPSLGPTGGTQPPAGWPIVYQHDLRTSDVSWGLTGGCAFQADGLYASSGGACVFLPSTRDDLTSQGFLLELTVAPAGAVPQTEAPQITFGNDLAICLDQLGSYAITTNPGACGSPLDLASAQGTTIAWHTDAFLSNSLSLLYQQGSGRIVVSANGQQVASVPVVLTRADVIALGASSSGAALYTRMALYSAPVGS